MNRPLGGRVAVRAAVLGMSPNQLTAISAVLGAAGIVAVALLPAALAGIVGALLLLMSYVFDSADGQLARIQHRGGPAGEWLDHVVDGIRGPLVHAAVAVQLSIQQRPDWLKLVALLFAVLVSSWFLSQLLAEKLLPRSRPGSLDESRKSVLDSFVKQPQDASSTYVVLLTLGITPLFTVLYVLLFLWLLAVFALSLTRKYRQLRSM